jgi:cation:H+ antiporter
MEINNSNNNKHWLLLFTIVILSIAWIIIHHSRVELGVLLRALLPGIAVFASAFMLSWAAELAMIEIPGAVAFALLAVVAVLPEYAVDIYFAWEAAKKHEYIQFATANMTGANRLLIGFGWPVILFAYWLKSRKRGFELDKASKLLIVVLFVATFYSFVIPIKGTLSIIDAIVFLLIFIVYIYRATKQHVVEPELEGISEMIGSWATVPRRLMTVFFFLLAGYTIYISAEPFAEGLLEVGRHFGIEEFILVQWLAPLASESPEFIVAVLFALRVNPRGSFDTMVSSKINQWTLLVGMLPLAFSLSLGAIGTMHLDFRQREEILLTSAQSLFAVVLISNFNFSLWEALSLFILFSTQLFFTSTEVRFFYSFIYILSSIVIFVYNINKREGIIKLFLKK